jgi:dTDP-4-amino-4,6-dideoxygalactose transaminase
VGAYSFFPSKNLGAFGDAGCVITNSEELATKIRMFANHGGLKKHEHLIEGTNSRLDGLQASILSAKLPYLPGWTARRREIAKTYSQMLRPLNEITTPAERAAEEHVYHLYVIRAEDRDGLRQHLTSKGIETGVHYPTPLPFVPAYTGKHHSSSEFPVAVNACREMLSLPLFPEISDDDVAYVAHEIASYYGQSIPA